MLIGKNPLASYYAMFKFKLGKLLCQGRVTLWNALKISWLTVLEGYTKALFSIAKIRKCRGGRYSCPCIVLLTLDPYIIMMCVKQAAIKYHSGVFCITRPGIETRSPGQLGNTLTIIPMGWYEKLKRIKIPFIGVLCISNCNTVYEKHITHVKSAARVIWSQTFLDFFFQCKFHWRTRKFFSFLKIRKNKV